LPSELAFCLLAIQIAIPWKVPHFVTQDGPSYLYNAVVAKKLLFHEQPYAALYRINPHIIPSWASTILFALSASLAGAGHAEQLIMSLTLCLGFFSFSYAIRALAPKALPFTPLSNALLETWFLWMGFYNFFLGMTLLPLGIGFYARRGGKLTMRAAATLSFGLAMLFSRTYSRPGSPSSHWPLSGPGYTWCGQSYGPIRTVGVMERARQASLRAPWLQ
jgi:hypothetical protein